MDLEQVNPSPTLDPDAEIMKRLIALIVICGMAMWFAACSLGALQGGTFNFHENKTLAVQVIAEDGSPIGGATCDLGVWGTTTTKADGWAVFKKIPQNLAHVVVTCQAPGYRTLASKRDVLTGTNEGMLPVVLQKET